MSDLTDENIETPVTEGQDTTPEPIVEAGDEVTAPDPLAEARAEADKWKDMALRGAAELDNYRKRASRDLQEARAYGNADLLRSLLPILDNFEMGLEAARAENEKSMIYMGLSMVRRQISDFLKENGVDEVKAEGLPFDPHMHEAVSHEPSDEVADGSVLRVLRRGFKLKDRLLRAAAVSVSSGPADKAAV